MSLVRCPMCDMKTTERVVNEHLDRGCPETPSAGERKQSGGSFFKPSPSVAEDKKEEVSEPLSSPIERKRSHENEENVKTIKKKKKMSNVPLAEQLRPKSLDGFVGQEDIVGPEGALRRFIDKDVCPSIILWGPSGVGKTSLARIIAQRTKSRFVELSAAVHGLNDCKKIFEEAKNDQKLMNRKTILFLDEVHRFNRAQQDAFLPHVERGDITLIGATTENPSFKINSALSSRCRVIVLKKLAKEDIAQIMRSGLKTVNDNRVEDGLGSVEMENEAVEYLSGLADGDGRVALNVLEMAINSQVENDAESNVHINTDVIKTTLKRTHMLYDRVGDSHYDTISAFHKSVRGSDPDATLFYLGRMLEAGEDPLFVARRMVRIASEDVGLADDSCLPFAVNTFTAVQQIGMPEADCILAHCAVKLAQAPKSVLVYRAYNEVKRSMKEDPGMASAVVPIHLRNAPTKLMAEIGYGKEYKYNPQYQDGQCKQAYMPDGLEDKKFLGELHLGTDIDPDL